MDKVASIESLERKPEGGDQSQIIHEEEPGYGRELGNADSRPIPPKMLAPKPPSHVLVIGDEGDPEGSTTKMPNVGDV